MDEDFTPITVRSQTTPNETPPDAGLREQVARLNGETLAMSLRDLRGLGEQCPDYRPSVAYVCKTINMAKDAILSLLQEPIARAEKAEAELVARANSMTSMRDKLINVRDGLEDEGDRVYFGSTNDADAFREAVVDFDEWNWHDILRDTQKHDVFAASRAAHARAEKAEAGLANISDGVRREMEDEKSGFWRSCSGCHETIDGQSITPSRSNIFKCDQGGGCYECGGLGVVWDNLNYADYGNDEPSPTALETAEARVKVLEGAASKYLETSEARIDASLGSAHLEKHPHIEEARSDAADALREVLSRSKLEGE